MVKLNKKEKTMNSKKTTTKKQTAVSTVKVAISLTLLVTALNLAGYLAISSYGKYFCAGVCALLGLYALVRNSK